MSTLDDLSQVIDRIPFLGTMRADLSQLRRILVDRRAPRILALAAPGAGRTTIANELLAAAVLPAMGDRERAAVVAPEAQWVHVRAAGRSLDWLELDASNAIDGDRRNRLEHSLKEAAPDVIVLAARRGDFHAEELAATLAKVRAFLGEQPPPAMLAVLTHLGGEPEDEVDRALAAFKAALAEHQVDVARPVPFVLSEGIASEAELVTLADELYNRLPDAAHVEAARAFPVSREKKREVARLVVHRSSTIAVTVGLAPVPFSDAVLLIPLQSFMVTAIAYIAGQPWDARAGAEWLGSVGVLGAAAFGLRWGAQQLVKLMPGAGTLLSASVAGTGTLAIGRSAIAYFIDGPGLRRPRALLPASASA